MTDARAIAGGAQAKASDPAVSAWVSANAGTGKTHVLVNRIIRLMLEGAAPERILCLTFTRAAAAEMASRLVEALGKWIAHDDDTLSREIAAITGGRMVAGLASARRLFARALETPGGLKVQTIHAFCERLLQRFPVEAGVTPGFTVLEPTTAKTALVAARSAVLGGADGDGEIVGLVETLAVHLGLDDLTDLVGKLIDERGRLDGALDSDAAVETTLCRLAAVLDLKPDGTTPDPAAALTAAMGDEEMRAMAGQMAASDKATDRKTADALNNALATPDGVARLAALAKKFLKGDGDPIADSTLCTAAMGEHRERLAILRDEVARLTEFQKAAGIHSATSALLRLGRRVMARYEHEKRQLAGYDYDDLIARTLGLLTESSGAQWVLYKLDGGLDHILIDEAQDTSPDQWEIVRLLADEFFAGEGSRDGLVRTIFAVGDKKQSIFSFQGADPALFDKMRDYFSGKVVAAGAAFTAMPLETSFRSVEAVLSSVDEVFNHGAAAAGVKTVPGEVMVHQAIRAGEPGLVEIWPIERPPEAKTEEPSSSRPRKPPDARRRSAELIAATVEGWWRDRVPLVPGGPPIRPRDVLILVRQRPFIMPSLVKALKERGVPVAGPDRLDLADHVAVRDLVSLGRFVLQPGDDLALAETLKSPLLVRDDGMPIDDDDLFAIAHGRGKESLWTALRRHVAAGAPYGEAVERLQAWQVRAASATAGEFYQDVLAAGGGLKALQGRLGNDAVDAVENFLQLAFAMPREKVQSLREFLDAPGGLDQEFKRDMGEAAGEVRIMTVHGAKGLQAPIVILADAAPTPDRSRNPGLKLLSIDDEPPLPVWQLKASLCPKALMQRLAHNDARSLEEYNRLLYVAMTRARDRLYVAGAVTAKQRYEGSWHEMVHNALGSRAVEVTLADGRLAWRIEDPGTLLADAELPAPPPPPPAPLPDWALAAPARHETAPPWVSPSAIRALMRPEAASSSERIASPLAGDGEWRFRRGQLVHRLLQILPDQPGDRRQAMAERFLAHAAPEMPPARHQALIAEVLGVMAAPAIAVLFGPGSLAEVPLVAEIDHPGLGKFMVSGRLDRIAVREDEVLIADYKTNRPVPAGLDEADPAHIAQLAAYGAGLETIYPGRRIRAFLSLYGRPAQHGIT